MQLNKPHWIYTCTYPDMRRSFSCSVDMIWGVFWYVCVYAMYIIMKSRSLCWWLRKMWRIYKQFSTWLGSMLIMASLWLYVLGVYNIPVHIVHRRKKRSSQVSTVELNSIHFALDVASWRDEPLNHYRQALLYYQTIAAKWSIDKKNHYDAQRAAFS